MNNSRTSHDPIMTLVVSIVLVGVVIALVYLGWEQVVMPHVNEIKSQIHQSTISGN